MIPRACCVNMLLLYKFHASCAFMIIFLSMVYGLCMHALCCELKGQVKEGY